LYSVLSRVAIHQRGKKKKTLVAKNNTTEDSVKRYRICGCVRELRD